MKENEYYYDIKKLSKRNKYTQINTNSIFQSISNQERNNISTSITVSKTVSGNDTQKDLKSTNNVINQTDDAFINIFLKKFKESNRKINLNSLSKNNHTYISKEKILDKREKFFKKLNLGRPKTPKFNKILIQNNLKSERAKIDNKIKLISYINNNYTFTQNEKVSDNGEKYIINTDYRNKVIRKTIKKSQKEQKLNKNNKNERKTFMFKQIYKEINHKTNVNNYNKNLNRNLINKINQTSVINNSKSSRDITYNKSLDKNLNSFKCMIPEKIIQKNKFNNLKNIRHIRVNKNKGRSANK